MGMLLFDQFIDAPKTNRKKNSEVIYTFDIEVTSLFKYKRGWGVFNPKYKPDYYDGVQKAGVPYIWMVGVEVDGKCQVYYGREFSEVEKFLIKISDPKRHKIIWVHNLSYETQFLRDILQHYTITKLMARQVRKPIRYIIEELNIEFRCSYMLTNLSLEKAGKRYTTLEKKSGDLNYRIPRSPLTPLSDTELGYCEYDIRVLHDIIRAFRDEYGSLHMIPFTQTGEVRKELRSRVDQKYIYNVRRQTAPNAHIQDLLMQSFAGGLVHGSYLHCNKTLYNYLSGDMASAYPACIISEKYPCGRWYAMTPERCNSLDRDNWACLYHVKFKGIRSRYINHYILASKCLYDKRMNKQQQLAYYNVSLDNGRVISANVLEMVLTEVDFDIIRDAYEIDDIEYIECYINRKDYMAKELIEYVLDLYGQKTMYKNLTSEDGYIEAIYMKSKQRLNSIFGCCVTSIFRPDITYHNDKWDNGGAITPDLISDKLDELRKSRTNCFVYSHGVYVTAYTRRRTWEIVKQLDAAVVGVRKAVAYYDTDSTKAPDSKEFRRAMENSNKVLDAKLEKMCSNYDIDPDRLHPKDPDGIDHPIGHWEIDGDYLELRVLGAKRYCYRDRKTGKLHLTVSGVNNKFGVNALQNDINNFKRDMIFKYKHSRKLISHYIDKQEELTFKDRYGVPYTSTQQHGICFQDAEYNLSIDGVFWDLIQQQELEQGDVI